MTKLYDHLILTPDDDRAIWSSDSDDDRACPRSTANNVEIVIPVPQDADSPKFKTTIGEEEDEFRITGMLKYFKCEMGWMELEKGVQEIGRSASYGGVKI